LGDDDRYLNHAARRALESQEARLWADRALRETNAPAAVTALLALVRTADGSAQSAVPLRLAQLASEQFPGAVSVQALGALGTCLAEWGKADAPTRQQLLGWLSPLYPAPDEKLNRELCQLLVFLEEPEVVRRTLALLESAPTVEEQIDYLLALTLCRNGWTLEDRRDYFHWLNRVQAGGSHRPELARWFWEVGRSYEDGTNLSQCIVSVRKEAVAALSAAEYAQLKPIITGQLLYAGPAPAQRTFVKEWKVKDLLPALGQVDGGRSFSNGKAAFEAAQCLTCHRLKNTGGSVGPDLTAVGARLNRRELLESILAPAKNVAEQYRNTRFALKDGEDVSGRIVEENEQKVIVISNALTGVRTEIARNDIESATPSTASPMPEGLADILTQEEILDLVAYLESAGTPAHAAFSATSQ
jgi:putative heme-binding domain-containing protein